MVLPVHAWIELNVSKAAKSSTPASADLGKGMFVSPPFHIILSVGLDSVVLMYLENQSTEMKAIGKGLQVKPAVRR